MRKSISKLWQIFSIFWPHTFSIFYVGSSEEIFNLKLLDNTFFFFFFLLTSNIVLRIWTLEHKHPFFPLHHAASWEPTLEPVLCHTDQIPLSLHQAVRLQISFHQTVWCSTRDVNQTTGEVQSEFAKLLNCNSHQAVLHYQEITAIRKQLNNSNPNITKQHIFFHC